MARPPVLALHRPVRRSRVTVPGINVEATIKSDSAIQRADVIIGRVGRLDRRISIPADELIDFDRETQLSQNVRLDPGINRIELEVMNSTGMARVSASVTYVPPPVSIEIDRIVSVEGGAAIIPGPGTESPTFDREISSGQARLQGRLSWISGQKPPGQTWTIQLWTNGFLNPLRVSTAGATENGLQFELPITLNRTDNRLRIEAAELPLDESQRARLADIRVICTAPEREQDLHLVIVGVEMENGRNVADPAGLRRLAERALRLHMEEDAFRNVEIDRYGPLTGTQAKGRIVQATLRHIAMRLRQDRERGSDVVMLYYQGREHHHADGRIILEDAENWVDPGAYGTSLTPESLAASFQNIPGAHVVLLDVDEVGAVPAKSVVERWPAYPNLGLLRVASRDRRAPGGESPTLLSMLETAISEAGEQTKNGEVVLLSVEKAVHDQFSLAESDSRMSFRSLVPGDLAQLIIGRLKQDQPLP